jgi:hypothetical protein
MRTCLLRGLLRERKESSGVFLDIARWGLALGGLE